MTIKELLRDRRVFLFILLFAVITVFWLGFGLGMLYDALLVSYVINSLNDMVVTMITAGVVE